MNFYHNSLVLRSWLFAEYKHEAMEALKLAFELDTPESRNAIAITADQKDYSYGELIRSASHISALMQSAKSNGPIKTTGQQAIGEGQESPDRIKVTLT